MTVAPAASPAASGSESQLIESTLRAAAGVTGMQLVFVSAIDGENFTWRQVSGSFPGITAGRTQPLAETFCGRLLGGAPSSTADAAADPAYAEVPMRALGIVSYVGVPLRQGGVITGTLGGISSQRISTPQTAVRVLAGLGRNVIAEAERDPEVRLHRTATGWEVEQGGGLGLPTEDISVSMSLGDLIAGDTGDTVPPQRPERPSEDLSETDRLRVQISQLEHALSARVVIEQAIGVLAQRFSLPPRDAFDRLRKAARSRGQRVHDLAVSVVRSARDEAVGLPRDLR